MPLAAVRSATRPVLAPPPVLLEFRAALQTLDVAEILDGHLGRSPAGLVLRPVRRVLKDRPERYAWGASGGVRLGPFPRLDELPAPRFLVLLDGAVQRSADPAVRPGQLEEPYRSVGALSAA